jgi:hypothetical protein
MENDKVREESKVESKFDEWTHEERRTLREKLGAMQICGCGSSDSPWNVVKLLLDRALSLEVKNFFNEKTFYDEAEDASGRWVEFGAKVLDSYGLLEHGTSIGCAWLTDDGRLLLRFIDEFGQEDSDWPEWAYDEQ